MNNILAAINSGRSQMKMEVLSKIWSLLEEAARKEDEQLVRTLYRVHQKVHQMSTRVQDKTQEESGND